MEGREVGGSGGGFGDVGVWNGISSALDFEGWGWLGWGGGGSGGRMAETLGRESLGSKMVDWMDGYWIGGEEATELGGRTDSRWSVLSCTVRDSRVELSRAELS